MGSPQAGVGARWFRGRRQWQHVLASAVLVGGLLTLLGPSAGSAPAVAALPPGCPAAQYPVLGGSTATYAAQVSGTLTGTVTVTTPLGVITIPPAGAPALSASFCGLVFLASRTTVIPCLPNSATHLCTNPSFSQASYTTSLGLANTPIVLGTAGDGSGTLLPQVAPSGGLNITVTAPASSTTNLLGVSCTLKPLLSLSTTASPLNAVVGPLNNATATLTGGGTIPVVTSTGSTGVCPDYIASQINTLIGLPNASVKATFVANLDICVLPVSVCALPAGGAGSARRGGRR